MARIALINVPFASHVAAMLRIADVLARAGHELIIWAPEQRRDDVEEIGAQLVVSSPEMPQLSGTALPAALAERTEQMTEELLPQLHRHDVDLVIRDSQAQWAFIAARYLGIASMVSHPMFPMTETDLDASEIVLAPGPDRDRLGQIRRSILQRWGVDAADLASLAHSTAEPTLIFSTEEILGDRATGGHWRCVGPLLTAPDPPRRTDRPVIYACFGTAQNRRTGLFACASAALADLPLDLVISAGGRRPEEIDLGPLPSNVTLHAYLPSREVLAAASVHITHGGCNSVHESLVAGVPMVCLPQDFDQIPLARRVAELGVGVTAAPDAGAVRSAVLALLEDRRTRDRVAALSERLRSYDGEHRLTNAVVECLGSAGGSGGGGTAPLAPPDH